jgi:hypothetical protein
MDLGAKLQIRPGQSIAVLDAPADLELDLPDDSAVVQEATEADAVIVFVRDSAALSSQATTRALDAARSDRLTWLVYPKAGQLGTDLNRDRLWAALSDRGVRPVRQVSIDPVWSALRFRPT